MTVTRVEVPGNRWDLLDVASAPTPSVSVVVPYYCQAEQLQKVWAALCVQDHPRHLVQVVLADDGSPEPPPALTGGPEVVQVRQDDLGFRAAAARNLGARASDGEVLLFLDADTVPEPDYVSTLVRRPALCPDVLAVGRRRHRDPATGAELAEPAWLRDGHAASRDLLDADGLSFRFVLSAVLGLRRELWDDLGGFDERYVGYGGEDWDLAYRAWNNGAVLVHEPTAVAWHEGPEWAGRDPAQADKDRETLRLAALVPPLRGGVPGRVPDVLVDLSPGSPGDTARCVHALLGQDHRDLAVRQQHAAPELQELWPWLNRDWSRDERARARVRLDLQPRTALAPTEVGRLVAALDGPDPSPLTLTDGVEELGTAVATRAAGRARRWDRLLAPADRWPVEVLRPRDTLDGFLRR